MEEQGQGQEEEGGEGAGLALRRVGPVPCTLSGPPLTSSTALDSAHTGSRQSHVP